MKAILIKNKIRIPLLFLFVFLITCNYHFEFVNQPAFTDRNSTFDIEITVRLEEEDQGGIPYFGIRLPSGWTVMDSISYNGVLSGTLIYSAAMSDSMEMVDNSPANYYWWVSIGDTVDSLLDGTVSLKPRIQTDDQTGLFSIDYMLGDGNNGLNFRRSNNHLISVGLPISVTVTNTNDSGEGSLRQAISEVSNHGEILFDLSYPATIMLDSQLVVDRYVSITGPDSGQLMISGNNQARVFYVKEQLNVTISNLAISGGNVADSSAGGGIYCRNSDLNLKNVVISDNVIINGNGGGLYCEESGVWLENVKIIRNSANSGQLNADLSTGGNGGGIFCNNSNVSFSSVTIADNSAGNVGGGIAFIANSNIMFDNQSRSNIYFNTAVLGNDLYNDNNSVIHVVLDTFSVLYPTSYYAYPPRVFTFDILNAKIVISDADLYVSLDGDNSNDGISPSEALKNISVAFSKIMADSLHPHTIYIDNGIYSPSVNGEIFPVIIPDYVTLCGTNRDSVILDAENKTSVVQIFLDDHVWGTGPPDRYKQMNSIENMTIKGGNASGIQCWESILNLNNVTITDNSTNVDAYGGGITCEHSILNLMNVTISNNISEHNGGGIMSDASNVDISFANISNNSAANQGGGIFCKHSEAIDYNDITVTNAVIAKNKSATGGGIYCQDYKATLTNVTVTNNSSIEYHGGIYSDDNSLVDMINSILWYNSPDSINPEGPYIFAVYSDIQGGFETGINGNIDADPFFADTIDFYLHENSPCIDAGDPDTLYNDREDTDNSVFALWPAMGTLRNDMGAYGGHGKFQIITEIKEEEIGYSSLPSEFRLFQNYPNPFNPTTKIKFTLPKPLHVTLNVFNTIGQKVAILLDKKMNSGSHEVQFDASNSPSGIYFYRIQADEFSQVRKMVLLK